MKMRPEIKELWVEALKSGRYSQARNTLRRGDSFCCLGVLCDLYLNHSKDTNSEWNFHYSLDAYFVERDSEKKDGEFLPECVQEWAGIDVSNPAVKPIGCDDPVPLSALNDEGYDFPEIARLIKNHL